MSVSLTLISTTAHVFGYGVARSLERGPMPAELSSIVAVIIRETMTDIGGCAVEVSSTDMIALAKWLDSTHGHKFTAQVIALIALDMSHAPREQGCIDDHIVLTRELTDAIAGDAK